MGRYGAKNWEIHFTFGNFFHRWGGLELRAGSSNCGTNPRGEEIND